MELIEATTIAVELTENTKLESNIVGMKETGVLIKVNEINDVTLFAYKITMTKEKELNDTRCIIVKEFIKQ